MGTWELMLDSSLLITNPEYLHILIELLLYEKNILLQ